MTSTDEELSAGRLGRTVGGRWRLESVLGVGGMAAVYAARDASGSVAAIKILHPEMSVRREVRERFLREGYVANHIGHAGVVRALEHGDSGDEVFLAMELLGGETLRSRVQRHGRLPVGEVLDYADQILDVLGVAHQKGVVHRDLKPDNLFVSTDGRIKILDFGLARVLEGVPAEHRTRTGVALGTLAYMAPEQALGRRAEIDGRVDIFALGATMFRILAGRRVHEAESEAELLMAMASRPAPPLVSVIPDISPAVAGVVDLALAFSRDARYPDARTMQADVRALRQGQPGPYASARHSAREEATRADMAPPTSGRTQPLSATLGSNLPGTSSTMPMPVASRGVVIAAPGFGPAASAPPQSPSAWTAPLAAPPPEVAVAARAATAHMPGPASFASTMPSTPPHTVLPAIAASQFVASQPVAPAGKTASRGPLVLLLVLGFVGVALAGGAGAWYYFGGSGGEAEATPLPSALAPAAPAAPASSVATPSGSPEAPAEPATDTSNTSLQKTPASQKGSAPAPSASASAALGASAAPTAATPAPAAPAAPAATGDAPAAPGAPAAPAAPATPTSTAPAPASPTAAPTAAPTATTPPAPTPPPDSQRRRKGRSRN